MITLQGKNLSERHKELNLKVEVSAQNNVAFQPLKSAFEVSDVDRLFKIDLASKYKKIDFIIEQLKCGDSLYISRALKCEWMYDREYAHIINPDYLHDNIFPTMSLKMKNKTISTISIYVRDETRAQLFYEYCTKENMTKQAHKFLIFTSESYKLEFLSNEANFHSVQYEKTCIELIGNSFLLLDMYGKMGGLIKRHSNMYSMNETEFLNLYEKYTNYLHYVPSYRVGAKMSRSILKKHKDRVLRNPPLYLSLLKTTEVVKYSSSEDAKIYAMALLPEDASKFWGINFCTSYKHIIDLIGKDKFKFVKQIFTDKYPCEEFEMNKKFYDYSYYELMNEDEKETWALMHLQNQLRMTENQSFNWYAIVKFSTAYDKLQKEILNEPDMSKKTELLNILIRSAKTNKEIEELLYFYYEIYETHFIARKDMLRNFLETVTKHHKVLEFDDSCWCAFDKLLQTLGLYDSILEQDKLLDCSIIYHIIAYHSFPYDLSNYLRQGLFFCMTQWWTDFYKLSEERKKLVYDYLFKLYLDKISAFDLRVYNVAVKNELRPYLRHLARLKDDFKNKDPYPDIILKFMKLDSENFKWCLGIKNILITEAYLIRCLKQNPSVIIDQFSLIEQTLENSDEIRLQRFYKKMKIYFPNDLAKQYLDLCKKSLDNIRSFEAEKKRKLILANVLAILMLGDESVINDLMDTYAPLSKKIRYPAFNKYRLTIQEAICRFHCYSRPMVPFAKSRLYLKGDYLEKCEEMFNVYLMHLTPKVLYKFVKLLLIIPSPVQKRGFRLAFQVMKTSGNKDYVTYLWSNMINFTMRKNLYTFTIAKMKKETPDCAAETLAVLLELTLDIHEDDEEEVFKLFRGHKIPESSRGIYLQTALEAVSLLPENNPQNLKRRTLVINAIKSNVTLMNDNFVMSLINDCLQQKWADLKWHPENEPAPEMLEMNDAKFALVIEYIVNIPNEEKQEKSLSVLKDIINHCFNHWTQKHGEEFCYQLFFRDFVNKLDQNSSCSGKEYSRVTYVFEYLLNAFEERFGVTEMYSYFWDWQLLLLTRKVINGKDECDKAVYIRFGLELGKFVIKLKMRNCYYTSFLRKIVGKISRSVEILCNLKTPPLTDRYVKILIAHGLTLHDMFETYVLALEMLPQDLSNSPVNETELQEMIKKIKEEKNAELTALLNDKFIYSSKEVKQCCTVHNE